MSNDEEAPFLGEDGNSHPNGSSISAPYTFTVSRAISMAASVSVLAVFGIALFHSLDINKPSSMETMTSLGKSVSSNAKANLFDTVLTDIEQGVLSAEEAMGIYNPDGEECILRPQEHIGKRCKSTSGFTKFSVDAVDGKWPEGFSWTILKDEGDGDIGRGLLHTERGRMSEETSKKKCTSFVTEVCAPDKFVVYATSDKDVSANSVVNVCGKKVADGEALDFTDTFFSCQAGVDITGDDKNKLLAGLAANSLSGVSMVSGSLSGISGSMNYGSVPTAGTDQPTGSNSTNTPDDESPGSNSTNVPDDESPGSNSTNVPDDSTDGETTPASGGNFEPTEPTDDAPTEGGVERTQISSEGTDYKICNINNVPRSYLLHGVTVGAGCLALADKDLTTIPENPQYSHANLVVVCGNRDSGTIELGTEVLSDYDLVYDGQSLLSSMLLDKAGDVRFYMHDGHEGLSKHYAGTKGNGAEWSEANQPFTFAGQKYSSTTPPFHNVGDNVKSLEFTSTTDELTDCGSYDELKRYFKKDEKKLKAAMADMKLKEEATKKVVSKKAAKANEKKLAYEKLYKETMAKKKASKAHKK